MKAQHFALLACAMVIAACQTPPPPPLAVEDISHKVCAESIDLSSAVDLAPERGKKKFLDLAHTIGADAACIRRNEANSNYVVFRLPAHGPNHTLTVGGAQDERRTLAVSVSLLDEAGETTRVFPSDKFMKFGNAHAVQFRSRASETYILVETDGGTVGRVDEVVEQRLLARSNSAFNPAAGYSTSYTTYHGQDRVMKRTYSHEGVIIVRVQALNGHVGLPDG